MLVKDDAVITTPFGAVTIAAQEGQLAIELLASAASVSVQVKKQSSHPLVVLACQQVVQYLQQADATFKLAATQSGTAFQQRVWQAISEIPLGQTRSYSDIAHQIGSGPRAVANACGANNLPLIVPCHRVVAKNGIGGFMQGKPNGLLIKRWLLKHESVTLDGDRA